MMDLSIVGLRFDHLEPHKHALFSFEEARLRDACVKIKKQTQSRSVLLLATCDRLELWCEASKTGILEPFLRGLSLSPLAWMHETYSIAAQDALSHCFSLTCGLLSPLYGEDQIISQVQQAYERSVSVGCSSSLLAYLVQQSVTVAKMVQTQVDLQVVDPSIARAVLDLILSYAGSPVLVIGSSALARSVAALLADNGFRVYMTFRDIQKADLLLPDKAVAVDYERRLEYATLCPVVISATKGMEYTLTYEDISAFGLCIDLAPVRDIDPRIEGVVRIEDMQVERIERDRETRKALKIIRQACDKVENYLHYRSSVPELQSIAVDAANDLVYRLQAPLKELGPSSTALSQIIGESARKAFSHSLYALKKAQAKRCHVDLSKPLTDRQATYAGDPAVEIIPFHTMENQGWRLTRLQFGSHAATHMDSPAHMLAHGSYLDEIPVSRFFATAFVLDCSKEKDITVETVATIESDCDAVLFYTGGQAYLTEGAATYLGQRGVRIFGFDTENCDRDGDLAFPIHHIILGCNALILENLVNLEVILHKKVQLTALPLSYEQADGAPARVVATYEA